MKNTSLELILTMAGLVWRGWLFRDTHFIWFLELKANYSPKCFIVQKLANLIAKFNSQIGTLFYVVFCHQIWISKMLSISILS